MCEEMVNFKGEDNFESWVLGNGIVDEIGDPVVIGGDAVSNTSSSDNSQLGNNGAESVTAKEDSSDERSQNVVEDASDESKTEKDEEPAVYDIHSMEPPVYPPYEDLLWDPVNNRPYVPHPIVVENKKPETATASEDLPHFGDGESVMTSAPTDDLPPEFYDDEPETSETNHYTMEPAPTDDLPDFDDDKPVVSESDVTEEERSAMEAEWAKDDAAEEERKAREAEEKEKKEKEERRRAEIAAEKANADLRKLYDYNSPASCYTLYNYAHVGDDERIKNSFLRTDNDFTDSPTMAALVGAGYTGYMDQEMPRMYIKRTNSLTAKEIKERYILNKSYTPIMGVHGGNFALDLRTECIADMDDAGMGDLTEKRRKECALCMDRLAETQVREEEACKAKGHRSSHDSGYIFDILVPEEDKRWIGMGFKPNTKCYDDLRQIAVQFLPAYTQVSLDDPSLGSYTVMAFYHEHKNCRMITMIIIPRAYYPKGDHTAVIVEACKDAYRNAITKARCHEGDKNAELFRKKGDAIVIIENSYFGRNHRDLKYAIKKFIFRQNYAKSILARIFFAMGGCRFVTGYKIGRLELNKARKADKKNGTMMWKTGMAINRKIIEFETQANEWADKQIRKYGDVVKPLIKDLFAKINAWMNDYRNYNTSRIYADIEDLEQDVKDGDIDYDSYDVFCLNAKSQDDINFVVEHCAKPMIARFSKMLAETGAKIQTQFAC